MLLPYRARRCLEEVLAPTLTPSYVSRSLIGFARRSPFALVVTLNCLVDLVRAVVNERDVIDAFTCVAPCPLLVIQLMPLRFIPSSAGAGWPSVGGAAASSLAGSPTAIATATESPNFASGQAEERAQCGKEEHSTRIQPSPRPSISRSGTGSNKVSSVLRNMRGE
jgi:hypothetical protein